MVSCQREHGFMSKGTWLYNMGTWLYANTKGIIHPLTNRAASIFSCPVHVLSPLKTLDDGTVYFLVQLHTAPFLSLSITDAVGKFQVDGAPFRFVIEP